LKIPKGRSESVNRRRTDNRAGHVFCLKWKNSYKKNIEIYNFRIKSTMYKRSISWSITGNKNLRFGRKYPFKKDIYLHLNVIPNLTRNALSKTSVYIFFLIAENKIEMLRNDRATHVRNIMSNNVPFLDAIIQFPFIGFEQRSWLITVKQVERMLRCF
jgi:hypothetical protein